MNKLNVLIAGGGDTAEIILKDFLSENSPLRDYIGEVIIIEQNIQRKTELERLGDVHVIEGDASNVDIYEKKIQMDRVDVVIALTGSDEINLLVLAIAQRHGVRVRIGVFKDPEIAKIVDALNLGIPVVRSDIVAKAVERVMSSTIPGLTMQPEVIGLPFNEYKLYLVGISERDPVEKTSFDELRRILENEYDAYPLFICREVLVGDALKKKQLEPGDILVVIARNRKFLERIKGETAESE